MQPKSLIYGFGLIVLLVLLLSLTSRTMPSTSKSGAPSANKSDLSVRLIGFTNNPVSTPPPPTGLAVLGNGAGLHALFAVTNTSADSFIRFEAVAVEWNEGGTWKEFKPFLEGWPTNQWGGGIKGSLWAPGFGCVQAVAWPGISTNTSWRLPVSVATDRPPFKRGVGEKVKREISFPSNITTITGPEVSLASTNAIAAPRRLAE